VRPTLLEVGDATSGHTPPRRWPFMVATVGGSLLVQKLFFESRYDVSGHASEHLASASAPFFGVAVIAILLLVTPRARRQPVVLLAAGAWLACTVAVAVGNVRVVDHLVRSGMADTSTADLPDTPAISAAHELANRAPYLAVVAALALTAALWGYRHVSGRVALGAAVLTVMFPPWMIPGAGVLVLVVARSLADRRARRAPSAEAATSGYAATELDL
jgi:hypothetical protein